MSDQISDCKKFSDLFAKKVGYDYKINFNTAKATAVVDRELNRLFHGKDDASKIESLVSLSYFSLIYLTNCGVDVRPIWDKVHRSNMIKYDLIDDKVDDIKDRPIMFSQ